MRGYRVWSIKDQYYISKDFCGINQDGKVFQIQSGHVFNFQDNFIVEFETGLEDKNSVKVFENDRVKMIDYKPTHPISTQEPFYLNFTVEYDNQRGMFILNHKSGIKYHLGLLLSRDGEVIGNIHDEG